MRKFVEKFFKPSSTQLVLGVALAFLAFALVIQLARPATKNPYEGMRQDDLIQVLDGLNDESERLNKEINELRVTRDKLQSGLDANQVSEEEAAKRKKSLSVLAGIAPASGRGVKITIRAPKQKLKAGTLLNSIQELKDAGAEVLKINDSIRLGVDSWIGDNEQGIVVDGQQLGTPIIIEAIGDPHALEEGAKFRGGLVSQIESPKVGGSVEIVKSDEINIESVREMPQPLIAKPA